MGLLVFLEHVQALWERRSQFASFFIRWVVMVGRQIEELMSIVFMLSGKMWTSLIPALGPALHCYLHKLKLALQLSSVKFFFFFNSNSIFCTILFCSIPPVPVFWDSLSMLAALLNSSFGRLAFRSLGWFAGLPFLSLNFYTVGTEKCQNKCRNMCQLLAHAEESWRDKKNWQKKKHC